MTNRQWRTLARLIKAHEKSTRKHEHEAAWRLDDPDEWDKVNKRYYRTMDRLWNFLIDQGMPPEFTPLESGESQ